jgi:hypothetical protein
VQPQAPAQSTPALLVKPAEPPAPVPAAEADPRAARLAALTQEQSDASNAYFAALQAALGDNKNPTAADYQKAQEQVKEPDTKGYLARAQALLDEDVTDITAFNTLRWMLNNEREPDSTKSCLQLLEKHHFARPEMADLCSQVAQNDPAMLDRLAASSPHVDVRGRALYAKAEALKNDIQTAAYIKGKEPNELEWLGADKLAALQSLEVEKTQKQIEQLYQTLLDDFGAVKLYAGSERETTLGARATAALFEIQHLVVGETTPEIEGVDLDSVAFKLSDYRGKVVLLDFWGNW